MPDNKKSNKNKIKKYKKQFQDFINDDLNTPEAISLMWRLIRDEKEINNKDKYKLILDFDKVFGLNLDKIKPTKIKVPTEIKKLIKEREKARKNKNWKKADEIREKLKKKGYVLEDTPNGPVIKKSSKV